MAVCLFFSRPSSFRVELTFLPFSTRLYSHRYFGSPFLDVPFPQGHHLSYHVCWDLPVQRHLSSLRRYQLRSSCLLHRLSRFSRLILDDYRDCLRVITSSLSLLLSSQPLHDTPVDVPEPTRSLFLSCLLKAIPDSVEADFGAIAKGTLDVIVEWKNKERSLGSLDIATDELVGAVLRFCPRRVELVLSFLLFTHSLIETFLLLVSTSLGTHRD